MHRLVDVIAVEAGVVPKDITGAAQTGDYVKLTEYQRCLILISQGAWAGGTPALTLKQATDASGTGEKALAFTERFTQVGLTGSGLAKTAVDSDTFNLPNVANTINVLDIHGSHLDVNNGFTHLRVAVASPGANADLLRIGYLLYDARFKPASDPKL